jgi:hypothetical protein
MPQSDKHEFNYLDPIDPTAARVLYAREDMLDAQYRVLQYIVLRTYEIAERECYFERKLGTAAPLGDDARSLEMPSSYAEHQNTRRPSQVYLVDGARGAGKTTLLITLRWLLECLGVDNARANPKHFDPGPLLKQIVTDLRSRLRPGTDGNDPVDDKLGLSKLYLDRLNFLVPHDAANNKSRRTAICLAVIHPADMEDRQPILEGIFAQMSRVLDARIAQEEEHGGKNAGTTEVIRYLKELRTEIIEKVARGWHLSRQVGVDAILRDSVDYKDYLNLIGTANQDSHSRVQTWRIYVNRFLDAMGAELLVILLYDADNKPEVTLDILNTARIFLDHPRIVTVLAGNLRSIRQSLVMEEFAQLSGAIESLRRAPEATEQDLRRLARRHTEEFIEKVLPRPNRFFVDLDSPLQEPSKLGGAGQEELASGYERLLGSSFDAYCERMLDVHRRDFVRCKVVTHYRYLSGANEIQKESDRRQLEQYMSWWLLRYWYEPWLKPRSARHLLAMRAFTMTNLSSPAITDRLADFHNKRLAVILFESPENFGLIHRFGDYDSDILVWLRRQRIASHWHGDRYFEINGVKHYSDTYPYRVLQYRIDLGIGLPIRENPNDTVPKDMLPHPAGPNLISQLPFFPRIVRPKPTGIAAQINHSLVPSNCYFMFGLQALTDLCWEDRTAGKPHERSAFWGHQLILEWPQYFHFEDASRRPGTGEDDAISASSRREQDFAKIEGHVRDYFVDIVIPLGSIHIGQYVRSGYGLPRRPGTTEECVASTLLNAEKRLPVDDEVSLVPTGLTKKARRFNREFALAVAQEARRMEYYRDLSKDQTTRFFTEEAGGRPRFENWERIIDKLLPVEPEQHGIQNHILSYRSLINDVRCAWAAARVFLAEIDGPLAQVQPSTANTAPRTRRGKFIRSSKYQVFSRASIRRWQGHGKYGQALAESVEAWQKPLNILELADSDKFSEREINGDLKPAPETGLIQISGDFIPTILRSELAKVLRYAGAEASARKVLAGLALDVPGIQGLLRARRKHPIQLGMEWPLIIDSGLVPADKKKRDELQRLLKTRSAEDRTRYEELEKQILSEDQAATAEAMKNRVARSYAAFLNALAPCLPSAIHLEVAGRLYTAEKHYAETNDVDGIHKEIEMARKEALAGLNEWKAMVHQFIFFVLKYRALLEIDLLRQTIYLRIHNQEQSKVDQVNSEAMVVIKELRKQFPSEVSAGIRLALSPDFSNSTLGLHGIKSFSMKSVGLILDPKILPLFSEEPGRKQSESDAATTDSTQSEMAEASEVSVTLRNLVECLNFANTLKVIVDGWLGAPVLRAE